MATRLSDTPLAENLTLWPGVFVPFTAFLKYDPIPGKRLEAYRDLQKKAAWVEDQLTVSYCSSGYQIEFAKAVAFTPQFGNQTSRLTITGHACWREHWVKQPITSVLVDSPNGLQTGYDASDASNMVPTGDLDDLCVELKNLLQSITYLSVIKLDVAGYIYGVKGTTFAS